VSEPSLGVPQYVSVLYMDGVPIARYKEETRRAEPLVDWMAANMEQGFWDEQSQIVQNHEQVYRVDLNRL
ncbi:HMR1 protein, partial [Brachypteracias leptosomus]|nr:HMR1 protein [Brachypteracias leptosomus]